MSTVSEQYFLDYCRARRYKVKRITPKNKAGRFPGYETTTPAGSVIVEIKEFTPNDEDNAFAATLEKEGKASFDNRSIGRRVRKAIIDSAPQLRRYKDTPLPEILLLYDNLASGSYGGIIDYLDPMNVGAGMFGEPVIRFWRDSVTQTSRSARCYSWRRASAHRDNSPIHRRARRHESGFGRRNSHRLLPQSLFS